MAEYIDRIHFDERVRIAVGISEGDLTNDFKDGVLFVLDLLKSEEIKRSKIDKFIEEIKKESYSESCYGDFYEDTTKIISVEDVLEIIKRNIGEEI